MINPCGYEGLEVTQISHFDSNVTLEDVESVAIKEIQTFFTLMEIIPTQKIINRDGIKAIKNGQKANKYSSVPNRRSQSG